MAVTLTVAELSLAIRLGDTAEETAQATRLLAYATEAASRYLGDAYSTTPSIAVNEFCIRLCGYLYDQPHVGKGMALGNAIRSSGAGAILLPYRVRRAGRATTAASDDTPETSSMGQFGFATTGTDTVTVLENTWTRTSLPPPTTAIAGINVEGEIVLFESLLLDGTSIVGADASGDIRASDKFSLGSTAGGIVVFAARDAGTYTVKIYEVGNQVA